MPEIKKNSEFEIGKIKGKGTYFLLFTLNAPELIQIGRLKKFLFTESIYGYVGSANGPGGLKARISHHLGLSSRPHWHMDYLAPYASFKECWFDQSGEILEHVWANSFFNMQFSAIPAEKFGSSDCRCPSHLFSFTRMPTIRDLKKQMPGKILDRMKINILKITDTGE